MNEVERLKNNLEILINQNSLDTLDAIVDENPNLNDISELNDLIETDISYWD